MKKGDLEIRYVILIILALVVLVTIILIFTYGLSDFAEKFKSIFTDVWSTYQPLSKPIE